MRPANMRPLNNTPTNNHNLSHFIKITIGTMISFFLVNQEIVNPDFFNNNFIHLGITPDSATENRVIRHYRLPPDDPPVYYIHDSDNSDEEEDIVYL